MKRACAWLGIVTGGAVSVACSTVPVPHRPTIVGSGAHGVTDEGLSISILADRDEVVVGDPIRFTVTYQNVGEQVLRLPRDLNARFMWVYPNGDRDNEVFDVPNQMFYSDEDVVSLAPGEHVREHVHVKTYYFDFKGITEFRAILRTARNTNPEVKNVWSGRACSNTFGVMVRK